MARHRDPGQVERGHEEQRHRSRRNRRRFNSDFSYISGWVKYSMFFFNFLFWLMGALLAGIGCYAVVDKWASGEGFRLENVFDIIFNLAFLLVIIGGVVFIVSFAGCIGALRENMCLLKFYSLCLLLFFLAEMALAALGFLLPHKVTGFLEGTLSDELISNYRDDLDFQNLIDLLQTDFDCCGISSAGYKDWSKNVYFNCTVNEEDNPSPERCGVPYSCCLPSARFAISGDDMLPNTMCGYQVQLLPERNVTMRISTQGCVPILRNYVEGNLHAVAGIALGVALAQLLVIWLSRTLEGQIENQRALWKYSSAPH